MSRPPCRPSYALVSLVCLFSLLCCASESHADEYRESLVMRPLPDGKVMSRFEFDIAAGDDGWEGHNTSDTVTLYQTSLLPRSLVAIVRAWDVDEFHLSLTSGRWDYSRWQDPIGDGAPSGGEIYAWIDGDDAINVQKKWIGLTNTLGGLFCSSLNKLDHKMTTYPVDTFFPTNPQSHGQSFFHGLLPLEHPCTENLTPFLRQLPCRGVAGLAQLLNPHKLFEASWQRLGIHVTRNTDTDLLHVQLEFELVQDPVWMTLVAGSQPRREWSLSSLFGRTVNLTCPIASSSSLMIDLAQEDENSGFVIDPQPDINSAKRRVAHFDQATTSLPLSLSMTWPVMTPEGFEYPRSYIPANITVERINSGYGLERGQLGVEITNNQPEDAHVTWLEEWPWWIKVYTHTMKVQIGKKLVAQDAVISQLRYTPAQLRGRPTVIEAKMTLPPLSVVRVVLDIERAYLWYTEYPPDSMRGFDVPSGVMYVAPTAGGRGRRIYTTSTLLDMPTPDFSMPYNVIILTSTVIALFFGSMFNLLTRTWLLVDLREPKSSVASAADGGSEKVSAPLPLVDTSSNAAAEFGTNEGNS
ncbi:Subunit of the glycosylphosphatidylinositol transamidase complex-like protein [Cystobasidiomycetes sp. EMM_F5]